MPDSEPTTALGGSRRWREQQYSTLVELALYAMSEPKLERVLNEVAERLRESLGCDFTKILDHRSSATGMLVRGGSGWPPGTVGEREVPDDGDDSQGAYTLRTGDPTIVDDMREEQRFDPPKLLTEHGVRSGIAVPIPGDAEPYGVLEADSRAVGAFDHDDVPLMSAYARLLGQVIEQHEREDANANFASIAAHEMRTPLTSVVGFSRRLLRRLDRDGQITSDDREELEFVVEEARRLQRSVELFLALGQIERRAVAFDRRTIDISEVVDSAIDTVSQLYPSTHFRVEYDDGDDHELSSDPLPLSRILGNLLENGAKYSPPDAEVCLAIRRDDESMTFEVSDQCGGVDDADFRQLFQRAFRGNGERRQRGLGIGLYVAMRLAEHLGGSVSGENRPPDGCAFELRLPLNHAESG